MLNIYISDSSQGKIDDFTLQVSCLKPKPTHKINLDYFKDIDDEIIDEIIFIFIERRLNLYRDRSVNAIINNNEFSYNIIDYDYNQKPKGLKTTSHYYEMIDKIRDIREYLPYGNINLFIHIF